MCPVLGVPAELRLALPAPRGADTPFDSCDLFFAMAETGSGSIRCSNCQSTLTVPFDWRLVQCPNCGHTMTRMEGDPAFD